MKKMSEDRLNELSLPLHRIIPFSNVEGLGNRTSIFLNGCNINCLFCHNPETIEMKNENMVSVNYLIEKIKESMPFIRGITVSGGEPTIHYKALLPLFREVHKLGLTCYIDTNGFFDREKISELLDNTDKLLFDIKGSGSGLLKLCFDYKNKDGGESANEIKENTISTRNFENLSAMLSLDKVEEVRLVYIKGFYDEKEVVKRIAETLEGYDKVIFKLIRVHIKGARNPKFLSKYLPKLAEVTELENFARSEGIKNIITIM